MQQTLYVASPESQQIHVWRLLAEGQLELLQVVAVSGQVQPMVLSPDQQFLYVGVRPQCGVVSYRIDKEGCLEEIGFAALNGSPTHISTDKQGRYLFSASYSGNSLTVSPIDATGCVQAVQQQLNELGAPHSANSDPSNRLLLVPCLKADNIRLYQLADNGELTMHDQPALSSAQGAGPRHMSFHPNGRVAYCINELNSTVDVLRISADGMTYTHIATHDTLPADFDQQRWSADIHLSANGRWLYVSERSSSTLTLFQLDESGELLTQGGFYSTETQPRGFALSHDDRYLIACGQLSDHVETQRIDPQNGKLHPVARYPVGKGPMWVTVRAV